VSGGTRDRPTGSLRGALSTHPAAGIDGADLREALARFVIQRQELGQGPLILDSLAPERVREVVAHPVVSVGGLDDEQLVPANPAATGAGPGTAMTPSPSTMASPPPSEHTGGAGGFEPPRKYPELRAAALQCTRCPLAGERTQVVFSDGAPDASVMVVGEAPGANEDLTGLPFVGRAGKLLDLLLASVDLSRKRNVYICNVLKCRPPGNRNPQPDEIESCAPWLRRQIELVAPQVILAVGTFSGKLLTGRDVALRELRGQVYTYQGAPLVVTYHPAALLRNPRWIRPTWDDLQLLRGILHRS